MLMTGVVNVASTSDRSKQRSVPSISQFISFNIFSYLMKQKEKGRIKHLGFSAHGGYETVKRFLEPLKTKIRPFHFTVYQF